MVRPDGRGLASTLFSVSTVNTKSTEDDQDRDNGVDDLERRVVLGLLGHVVGLTAVPEDGPEDQEQDEAADHKAGDEEALPQVERVRPCVVDPENSPKLGSLHPARTIARPSTAKAARTRDRRRGPGISGVESGTFAEGLVSDESTALTLSNPTEKDEVAAQRVTGGAISLNAN